MTKCCQMLPPAVILHLRFLCNNNFLENQQTTSLNTLRNKLESTSANKNFMSVFEKKVLTTVKQVMSQLSNDSFFIHKVALVDAYLKQRFFFLSEKSFTTCLSNPIQPREPHASFTHLFFFFLVP